MIWRSGLYTLAVGGGLCNSAIFQLVAHDHTRINVQPLWMTYVYSNCWVRLTAYAHAIWKRQIMSSITVINADMDHMKCITYNAYNSSSLLHAYGIYTSMRRQGGSLRWKADCQTDVAYVYVHTYAVPTQTDWYMVKICIVYAYTFVWSNLKP